MPRFQYVLLLIVISVLGLMSCTRDAALSDVRALMVAPEDIADRCEMMSPAKPMAYRVDSEQERRYAATVVGFWFDEGGAPVGDLAAVGSNILSLQASSNDVLVLTLRFKSKAAAAAALDRLKARHAASSVHRFSTRNLTVVAMGYQPQAAGCADAVWDEVQRRLSLLG